MYTNNYGSAQILKWPICFISKLSLFRSFDIADSSSETSFDVELLVGLDFYYNLIIANVNRGHH